MLSKIKPKSQKRYILLLRWIKKEYSYKRKVKILEIGAGDLYLKKFLPKNIIYYSMDFGHENNPSLNRSNNYDYLFNLDDGRMPISDKTFDSIICFETLEHTLYPKRVIQEIKRISKPNSLLFFSLPNEYNFVQRIYYLFGKKTDCDKPFEIVNKHLHIHKPRVKDILNLFSKNFKILEIEYIWQSKKLPEFVDRIINLFAQIWPSMFSRIVVLKVRF